MDKKSEVAETIVTVAFLAIFVFGGVCVIETGEVVVGGIIAGAAILAILGIVIGTVIRKIKTAKMLNLKFTGRRLEGTICNFSKDLTLRVNGVNPYIVHCTYTDEYGQEQQVQSERLWTDPELNLNIGDAINIYVDRNDERKYYIDVEDAIVQAGSRRVLDM